MFDAEPDNAQKNCLPLSSLTALNQINIRTLGSTVVSSLEFTRSSLLRPSASVEPGAIVFRTDDPIDGKGEHVNSALSPSFTVCSSGVKVRLTVCVCVCVCVEGEGEECLKQRESCM